MRKNFILTAITLVLVLFFFAPLAPAATTNPSPGSPGYMVMPITFDRTVSSASTPVMFRFALPYPAHVVGVSASAEDIDLTDTDETYTVDIQEAGTSILASAISIAAADTVYDGTVSDDTLADEAVLTGVLTVAGTTPSVSTVTVLLILKRL